METLKLFWLILKRVHGDVLLKGFLGFYLAASFVLWIFDPQIHSYWDGLWLGFNIATSIGLGDYTVTAWPARIAAAVLGVYGVVIVAFIPGLIASYYIEKVNTSADETIEQHYDDLEHLETLSKEQRQDLSRKIQEERRK